MGGRGGVQVGKVVLVNHDADGREHKVRLAVVKGARLSGW